MENKQDPRYIVVMDGNVNRLMELVGRYLDEGYACQGGVTYTRDIPSYPYSFFMQAMAK